MARKPTSKSAAATNGNGSPLPPDIAKPNTLSIFALIDDVRDTIGKIMGHETSNVKLNQRVAYDLFLYREQLMEDGIAPADLATLAQGGKPLTTWRSNIAEKFIGKAPSVKKQFGDVKSQTWKDAADTYKREKAIMDIASTLVIILGNKGITSADYNVDMGCFVSPVIAQLIIPVDRPWSAEYELGDVLDNGTPLPLDNRAYSIRGRNAKGERTSMDIRASVRQVMTVFRQKPGSFVEQPAQAGGRNDTAAGMFDDKTVKAVLAKQSIGTLSEAVIACIHDDPDMPLTWTDLDKKEQDAVTALARLLNAMLASVNDKLAA